MPEGSAQPSAPKPETPDDTYSVPLISDASAFVYLGEPALGAATVMQRFSGNPVAPIAHHWLDSAYLTRSVVTAGIDYDGWKLEGSLFNGRESDHFRWGFDPVKLDSGSARLTWNATSNWSAQVSYGIVKSAEQPEPVADEHRVTTSATYNLPLEKGNWQTTFGWGRNVQQAGPALDGFLVESAATWRRLTLFARAETVPKNELLQPTGGAFQGSEVSLGYVYDTPVLEHMAAGIGVAGTVDFLPSTLTPALNKPVSFMSFVHLKT
jgi:hypothetical protein